MGRRVDLLRSGKYTVVGFGIGKHAIEWKDVTGHCYAFSSDKDYGEFVAAVFDELLRMKRRRGRAKKSRR